MAIWKCAFRKHRSLSLCPVCGARNGSFPELFGAIYRQSRKHSWWHCEREFHPRLRLYCCCERRWYKITARCATMGGHPRLPHRAVLVDLLSSVGIPPRYKARHSSNTGRRAKLCDLEIFRLRPPLRLRSSRVRLS